MEVSNETGEINNLNLNKYYRIFAVTYILSIIAIVLFIAISKINIGSTAANIAEMGVCIFIVSNSFYKDNNRHPSKKEKRKMAVAFIIISLLISAFLLFMAMQSGSVPGLVEQIKEMPAGLLIIIAAVVSLLNYFIIMCFFRISEKIYK
jgi:hypothetical protein